MKKSKQSLNKTISRKDLINSFSAISILLIFGYFVLMFLFILQPEQDYINGGITYSLYDWLTTVSMKSYRFSFTPELVTLITVAVGLIIGITQFEFLHRKNYCSTLLSFGVNRKNLFRNRLVLPLVALVIGLIIPKLIALKFNVEVYGFSGELFSCFILDVLTVIQPLFVSYTCAVTASMFTGRTVEAIAGTLSIVLLPSTISILINEIFTYFLYGYGNYTTTLTAKLSNFEPFNILTYLFAYDTFDNMVSTNKSKLLVTVLWILVSIVIMYLLMRHFKNNFKAENAGFKGINKVMVYITSFTLPVAVAEFTLEYIYSYCYPVVTASTAVFATIIAMALGIVSAMLCNFIIHFTFKKVIVALLSGGTLCALILAFVLLGTTSIFGAYNKAPDINDIKSIDILTPYSDFFPNLDYRTDFSDRYVHLSGTTLHITEKEDIETVLEIHEAASKKEEKVTASTMTVSYQLKDGAEIVRNYQYLGADATQTMAKLWDTTAAKEMYKKFLFPKLYVEESEKSSIGYYYENPELADYNEEGAYLYITAKDGTKSSVLNEITEAEFIKLKNAIYDDICSLSSGEWFTPEESQIGTLSFNYTEALGYNEHIYFDVYLNKNMTNTFKVLKEIDIYKYLETKKEIKRVLVTDITEYVQWNNYDFSKILKNETYIHCPYFTQYYSEVNSKNCFFGYDDPNNFAPRPPVPVEEITNKLEIKSLIEKSYLAYNVGNNGKLVFIEHTDGTYITYVIPY